MTDRELLELAAKAAGITCTWRDVIRSRVAEFQIIKHTKHSGFFVGGKEWNPLEDDGDALRLAVTLGLIIDCKYQSAMPHDRKGTGEDWLSGDGEDDPYAATRRAIVRAAAEIGRNMQ